MQDASRGKIFRNCVTGILSVASNDGCVASWAKSAMNQPPELNIAYVAKLARIELTPDEQSAYARQLGDILHYLDKIKHADITGVEPSAHAMPVHNVWREDVAQPGLSVEQALRNAPQQRDDQIVVPRVVE